MKRKGIHNQVYVAGNGISEENARHSNKITE